MRKTIEKLLCCTASAAMTVALVPGLSGTALAGDMAGARQTADTAGAAYQATGDGDLVGGGALDRLGDVSVSGGYALPGARITSSATGLLASAGSKAKTKTKTKVKTKARSYKTLSVSATSGTCGTLATWSLSGGTLTIAGSGAMADYANVQNAPWYGQRGKIERIVIGQGITAIGKLAFANCTKATRVDIAQSVKKLGEACFYNCSSLATVTLPNGLETLGVASFCKCSKLAKVTGGTSYTNLPDYVFQETALKSFTIPASVTEVSQLAFFRGKVASLSVAPGNAKYVAKAGVLFGDGGKTLVWYPNARSATSYAIPEGTVTIGSSAFQECANLKHVTIADSVTSAGNFAFYQSSVESVKFGAGMKETSYQMFRESPKLAEIDFGGLTSLGAHTFAYCPSLKSVELPDSITKIGNGCFGECTGLESFSAKNIDCVPYQAFFKDTALSSVKLGAGVKAIYSQGFYGCTSLSSIDLPSSVTTVASNAFPSSTQVNRQGSSATSGGSASSGEQTTSTSVTLEYDVTYDQTSARAMLQMLNEFRTGDEAWQLDKNGNKVSVNRSALVYDYALEKTAMKRAAEIAASFSHTRPSGKICFTAFEGSYYAMGENIAGGSSTAKATMEQLKETNENYDGQGHRRNMLESDFNAVGIAHVKVGGVDYWVQDFGYAKNPNTTAPAESLDKTTTASCTVANSAVKSFKSLTASPESLKLSGKGESADAPVVNVTGVRLSETWASFSARCRPTWKSADESVAKVSGGKVTAAAERGSTELAATVLGKKLTVPVSVGTEKASASAGEKQPAKDTGTGAKEGASETPSAGKSEKPSTSEAEKPAANASEKSNTGELEKQETQQAAGAAEQVSSIVCQSASFDLAEDGTAKLEDGEDVEKLYYSVPISVLANGKSYKVTAIGKKAFAGNERVVRVTLGTDVKTIGRSAFAGCKKLRTLVVNGTGLTEASVKGCLKASSVITVKVPKAQLAKAKKLFAKANSGKRVTVRAL